MMGFPYGTPQQKQFGKILCLESLPGSALKEAVYTKETMFPSLSSSSPYSLFPVLRHLQQWWGPVPMDARSLWGEAGHTHLLQICISPALSHKLVASMGTGPDPANGLCALLITAGSFLSLFPCVTSRWACYPEKNIWKSSFFSLLLCCLCLPFPAQLQNIVQCHPTWGGRPSRDFWISILPNYPHRKKQSCWEPG